MDGPVARFFLIIILIFLVPTIYFATQIGYRKGQLERKKSPQRPQQLLAKQLTARTLKQRFLRKRNF